MSHSDKNQTSSVTDTDRDAYQAPGRIAFYHANGKGSGAALRFEFKPAAGPRTGCCFMEMAHQKCAASGSGSKRSHATFDWESKATVKLGFMDLCELLAVLRLKQPCLGANGKGLYHANGNFDTIIAMRTGTEHKGYTIGISRKRKQGEQVFKGHFVISPTEAIGLEAVLSSALFHIAFGRLPTAVAA